MPMMAEQVSIMRVENGWIVTANCAGSSVSLVAKSIDEVAGFVKGMEWQTPRPFYEQRYGGDIPQPAPLLSSGSNITR